METNNIIRVIGSKTKESLKQGVKMNAGEVLLDQTVSLVKPKLPMMARAYANTGYGRLIIAAVISAVALKFADNNKVVLTAADAMMDQAGLEAVDELGLVELVNEWTGIVKGLDFSEDVEEAVEERETPVHFDQ